MSKKVMVSWSGGKDACMAVEVLTRGGYEISCLVTTIPEETNHTFGHGEKRELIEAQGKALGVPVHFIPCSNQTYTEDFIREVKYVKEKYGATSIAFGDLYIEGHKEWGMNVATEADLEVLFPLWIKKEEVNKSLTQFISSGYKAKIIRVKDNCGLDSWIGKDIDQDFASALEKLPVCPMGESGEYHTFVYDGPLFSHKVCLSMGETMQMETTKRLSLDINEKG